VNNTLSFIGKGEVFQTKIFDIGFQLQYLCPGGRFFNEFFHIDQLLPIGGWDVVINRNEGTIGTSYTTFRDA
jgi:hypothetical protein